MPQSLTEMSREKFHQWLWTMPPAAMTALTGVTRSTQRYHARRQQLPTPPRGYFRRSGTPVVPDLPPFRLPEKAPVVRASQNHRLRRLEREELFELVWSAPVVGLAAKLGVSDVAVAKRCRSLSVPVPPRGYWRKKEFGIAPDRPALPPPPAKYDWRRKIERDLLSRADAFEQGRNAIFSMTKEQLHVLVWSKPKPAIREEYGIRRTSFDARCRALGVETPPRGHWRKIHRASAKSPAPQGTDRAPGKAADDHARTAAWPIDLTRAPSAATRPTNPEVAGEDIATSGSRPPQPKAPSSRRRSRKLGISLVMWSDEIERWSGGYTQSSSASRRAQLTNGLSAVLAAGLVSARGDIEELSDDDIKRACARLDGRHSANSIRSYRSAVISFRHFLTDIMEAAHEADEAAKREDRNPTRSVPLSLVLDKSNHSGRYPDWELKRDIAIASFVADGFKALEIVAMTAPCFPMPRVSKRSMLALDDYLSALRQDLRPSDGSALFVTSTGAAPYREIVGRAIGRLCKSAGVSRFAIADLRRHGARREATGGCKR
jgi:hypothetical protein